MRLVLDAGAFIAADRRDQRVLAFFTRAKERKIPLLTSSPIVGQVWRDGRRRANLARLLKGVEVVAPDDAAARRAGLVLAKTGMSDVVDALLACLCATDDVVLTSDPGDIENLVKARGVHPEIVAV